MHFPRFRSPVCPSESEASENNMAARASHPSQVCHRHFSSLGGGDTMVDLLRKVQELERKRLSLEARRPAPSPAPPVTLNP